jgi:hypothetical protein
MIALQTTHTDTSKSGAEPVTYVIGRNISAPTRLVGSVPASNTTRRKKAPGVPGLQVASKEKRLKGMSL